MALKIEKKTPKMDPLKFSKSRIVLKKLQVKPLATV